MSGLTWIATFICAAGCHLSSSSPAPRSPVVVHLGQNASLTCNITSSLVSEVIWYLLRSDQLQPLLKVSLGKLKISEPFGNSYSERSSRISWSRDPNSGLISLKMLKVEEQDSGLYFCSGSCGTDVCVNEGIHLKVKGVDDEEQTRQPCFSLGVWVFLALLGLCLVVMVGFYLSSGKRVCCCCNPAGQDSSCNEEEALHYSSLKHPDKPRPAGRDRPRFIEELVTYSTVKGRKTFPDQD